MDEIKIDNAIPAGTLSFPLSDVMTPRKFTLEVSIEGTPYANSWDFWVYPDELETDAGVTIHTTHTLDATAIEVLNRGGSVLLLPYGSVAGDKGAEVQIGFSSIFWNTAWTSGQAPHTLGILCNPQHPVFQTFPTEYHSNWQWWDPITHSQVMILDGFPASLKPLIQPIDTWFENRRLALAFEATAGNGKILVCSIDMMNNLEERPVSRQLYHSILDYMKSDLFKPENPVELSQIKNLLKD